MRIFNNKTKYKPVAIIPTSIYGLSTGFCPIHPKIKKSTAKTQKTILYSGRNCGLRIGEKFKIGNNNSTKIALTIATTPPNLSGIDRKIA